MHTRGLIGETGGCSGDVHMVCQHGRHRQGCHESGGLNFITPSQSRPGRRVPAPPVPPLHPPAPGPVDHRANRPDRDMQHGPPPRPPRLAHRGGSGPNRTGPAPPPGIGSGTGSRPPARGRAPARPVESTRPFRPASPRSSDRPDQSREWSRCIHRVVPTFRSGDVCRPGHSPGAGRRRVPPRGR